VKRRAIRERLGNVWRVVHGSDQGLGDEILRAYDGASSLPDADSGAAATSGGALNNDANDLFAFTLRRVNGPPVALAALKGKVIVLNFWAAWCVPCMQINAEFNDLAMAWSGEPRAVFLIVDANDQGADLASAVEKKKWHVPVVYADGLDRFLTIDTLPAAVVIAPDGHVIYRVDHPAARGFAAPISSAIQQALAATH
jgi:thiol-disulfide isomerase/thioredoxin